MRKKFLIIIVSLLPLACSFDPRELQRPQTPIPQKWESQDPSLKIQCAPLACIPWWHQLNDPELNKLVAHGLKTNNHINVAAANIEAAQGELLRIQLNWLPTIGTMLGYSSFPYAGFPGVITAIIPSYSINIFKQIKEQQQANFELKSTQAMRDGVRLTVIAQIIGSYLSYLAHTEALELLKIIDDDLTQFVQIDQNTYAGELFSKITVDQARSELNLLKGKEQIVSHNITLDQNAIRLLLSENPEKFHFKRHFSQLSPKQIIIGSLPLNVIENRPDLIKVRAELNASTAGVGVALSDFLPTVILRVARGDIATVPNGSTLGTPIYFNEAFVQDPLITFTTFGEVKKAKGISRAAYYKYINTVRTILHDINNDLSAHLHYSSRLNDIDHATQNILDKYQLNKNLYEQGIISYLDLLAIKLQLDLIHLERNQYKLDQMLTIVNLYQNLAVGYGCEH